MDSTKSVKAMLEGSATGLVQAEIAAIAGGIIKYDPTFADPAAQAFRKYLAQLEKIYYPFLNAAEANTGTDPDGTVNGWADPVLPSLGMAQAGAPGPMNLVDLLLWLSKQPSTAFAGLPQIGIDALNALVNLTPKPAVPPSLTAGS